MNPKGEAGKDKPPLWIVPKAALVAMSRGLQHGAVKYGAYNWRTEPISLSSHISPVLRHIADYMDGQYHDSDSGLCHLWHAIATLAIIIDAEEHGCLIDDRLGFGPAPETECKIPGCGPLSGSGKQFYT